MRAAVVHGAGDLRVDELPDPAPGEGQVLVSLEWGGICGSDLAYWRHGRSGTAVLRHPMVLGHEVAGRIVALGPGVTGHAVGQSVTFQPAQLVGDPTMPARLAGRTNLHPRVRYFGSAAFDPHTDGGFCGLKAVPAGQVRALPQGVSTRHGALAEPLAVALHAVGRVHGLGSQTVLVNGCGPIGCLVVAALKHSGAAHVVAADITSSALEVARAMGADEILDLATQDLPADIELVFEASGVPSAIGSVLRSAAAGGTVVQVGNLPGTAVEATLGNLVSRELTWMGSYRFAHEIDEAVAALGDGLDVEPLITHVFDLSDVEQAMQVAADSSNGGKVLLRLGDDR